MIISVPYFILVNFTRNIIFKFEKQKKKYISSITSITSIIMAAQTLNANIAATPNPKKLKPLFKRNYSACLNCRLRKVKCDLGSVDNPHDPPCARCKRERRECIFVESKRGHRYKTHSQKEKEKEKYHISSLNEVSPQLESDYALSRSETPQISGNNIKSDDNQKSEISNAINTNSNSPVPSINSSIQNLTNNATMIYLSHVAGKVAHADNRDYINGAKRLTQLEKSVPIPRSLSNTSNNSNTNMNEQSRQSSNNTTTQHNDTEPMRDSFGHDNSLFPIVDHDRWTIPPLTTTNSMRQVPSKKLANIEYICPSGENPTSNNFILTEIEARRLLKIFFITMHPFYPYIPKEFQDPDILAGYPMLLCALLAISSRYNPLPDKIGAWDHIEDDDTEFRLSQRGEKDIYLNLSNNRENERHSAIHEQLWIYCQRLMSMTVWGESSSRSIGTLLSFLIFTEWNPRAIHFRWGDYANGAQDDSLANKKFGRNKNVGPKEGKRKNSDDTADDYEGDDEEFAGLSAMKRSEIMSFMLIGTATRLSFLLDTNSLVFIATHVSEIHIAIGLNKKSMLQQTLSEVDINDPSFRFTAYQKANIELLQFFSLCYETLYGTRPKFISLDKYQTLAILDILSPILENWYKKYYKLLKPSNIQCTSLTSCNDDASPDWLYLISTNPKLERDLAMSIERESLIFDYYYTKLYLYSLALSGDTSVKATLKHSKKGRNLRLDELARYSRYVELAYRAAKEVLAVIQRVRKLRLLKYMPVRWVTRIIKSVSFIVKCYLTLTTDIHPKPSFEETNNENNENPNDMILKLSVIPLEEIIVLLQKTAICLRYAAPDELHLSTRYSTILMYLCSQFKTQMRERDDQRNNVREYEKEFQMRMAEEEDNDDANDANSASDDDNNYSGQVRELESGVPIVNKPTIAPPQTHQSGIQNASTNQQIQPELNLWNTTGSTSQLFNTPIYSPSDGTGINHNSQYFNNIENINFSNANQELFDDFFNKNPSEKLFNFFSYDDNNNPGLDFVDQFTKEIEKDFLSKGGKH